MQTKGIQKIQTWNILALFSFLAVCLTSTASAQTSPTTIQPADVPASEAAGQGIIISGPVLASPAFSAAAKAQIRKEMEDEKEASTLVTAGDALVTSAQWQAAQTQFQQALETAPAHYLAHLLALYGLIACCRATGDTAHELSYSRQAIYIHGSAVEGFSETRAEPLMQFALLLNKTGQAAEAISVYNPAAYLLDYEDSRYTDGKPRLKVLLPEVVMVRTQGDQVCYTPERLQALAKTGIAHAETGFGSNKEAVTHMQEAVKMYPDSEVTHYYLGEALLRANQPGSKAAYQKASELGDDRTRAAAKERIGVSR